MTSTVCICIYTCISVVFCFVCCMLHALQAYNIDIQDANQPLLVSKPKKREIRARGGDDSPLLLVPELCTRTGQHHLTQPAHIFTPHTLNDCCLTVLCVFCGRTERRGSCRFPPNEGHSRVHTCEPWGENEESEQLHGRPAEVRSVVLTVAVTLFVCVGVCLYGELATAESLSIYI